TTPRIDSPLATSGQSIRVLPVGAVIAGRAVMPGLFPELFNYNALLGGSTPPRIPIGENSTVVRAGATSHGNHACSTDSTTASEYPTACPGQRTHRAKHRSGWPQMTHNRAAHRPGSVSGSGLGPLGITLTGRQ